MLLGIWIEKKTRRRKQTYVPSCMGWHISTGRHHPQPLLFSKALLLLILPPYMYPSVPVEAGRAQAVIHEVGHIGKKNPWFD